MKNHPSFRSRQTGIAAVEFAVILPVMTVLIAFILLFGRLTWSYTAAQKAARDAALTVAMAKKAEMLTTALDGDEIAIARLARTIAQADVAQLNLGSDSSGHAQKVKVDITCDGVTCLGDAAPSEIAVTVRMRVYDIFLTGYTDGLFGTEGLWLRADARIKYAGN